MTSLKQPPVFNPDGGDAYADWKTDVEVWRLFTKEEKKRQGPAVYLSLQGNAREAIRAIDLKELALDDGYEKVVAALDEIFLKDETTRAFCAIKNFIEYRRESGQGFSKFLVDFNNRHRELTKYKLKFDDGLMAYFLLAAANLSNDHERLVRATASLKFDDMKDKMQQVFGEFDGTDSGTQGATLPIKEECLYTKGEPEQEECLYTKGYNHQRGRGGRGGYRGGHRGNPNRQFGQNQDYNRDQHQSQQRGTYTNNRGAVSRVEEGIKVQIQLVRKEAS